MCFSVLCCSFVSSKIHYSIYDMIYMKVYCGLIRRSRWKNHSRAKIKGAVLFALQTASEQDASRGRSQTLSALFAMHNILWKRLMLFVLWIMHRNGRTQCLKSCIYSDSTRHYCINGCKWSVNAAVQNLCIFLFGLVATLPPCDDIMSRFVIV